MAQANGWSSAQAVSADGRYVALASNATNLVAGDDNRQTDVFVHDRSTGTTQRVSVSSDGAQADGALSTYSIALSADGRFVAFGSAATNLVAGDTNGAYDVFVHDRVSGTTERVSVSSSGDQADAGSHRASISADGRFVAFTSEAANLVPGDSNGAFDVFVHDRSTGTTQRVSVSSDGAQADQLSYAPVISADGRYVTFSSTATNLVAGDTNQTVDVFVHDRSTGDTARLSLATSGAEASGYSESFASSVTPDGRYAAFNSSATHLAENDTNGIADLFVHDRVSGTTDRVSVSSSGDQADAGSYPQSFAPNGRGVASLSSDGRLAAFTSAATTLVAGDSNGKSDIFLHDRITRQTERLSLSSAGDQADDNSFSPILSADGRYVTFTSFAANLVAGDTNGTADIFVRDRETGITERLALAPAIEAVAIGDSTWNLTGQDTRGNTYTGTLRFDTALPRPQGDVLEGSFDWLANGTLPYEITFEALLDGAGVLDFTSTQLVGATPGIIAADYTADLNEVGTLLTGAWSGAGIIPGTWSANRLDDATTVTGPLVSSLLDLSQAAYETQGSAAVSGWTPVALPGIGSLHPSSAQGLENTMHVHEGVVNGLPAMTLSFSGTRKVADLLLQIGSWDDLFAGHAAAVSAALDHAVANGITQLFVTGHSLGGIMVEEFLAGIDAVRTPARAALLDGAYGVTFGSPGSPRTVADSDRLLNFVTLGDPVAMLSAGDFFGVQPAEADKATFAEDLLSWAMTGLEGISNPEMAASQFLFDEATEAAGLSMSREGVTVTILQDDRSGIDGFRLDSLGGHRIEGATGYRTYVEKLLDYALVDTRRGTADLDFWLREGDGWYPSGEVGLLDGFTIGSEILLSSFVNLVVFPGVKTVITGANTLEELVEADPELLATVRLAVQDAGHLVQTAAGRTLEVVGVPAALPDDLVMIQARGGTATQTSTAPALLQGSAADEALTGNAGIDILIGGAGDDVLRGALSGDLLLAGAGRDTLMGEDGDDRIDGGPGADLLIGGQGSDIILVDDAGDRVAESRKWAGSDTVISSVDFRMGRKHIEDLELSGQARIGAGNGLANTITGTAGDNILDGGKNNDTLIGGLGDDTYLLRAPGDTIVERAGEGIDVARSYGSFALMAHVEKLFMQTVLSRDGTPVNFNGIGNGLDNTIIGTPFDNTLVGREGSDTLKGQAGADTFVFDRAIGADVDRIMDFNVNTADEGDILKLKGAVFGGLAQGVLSADLFVSGTAAAEASERIIFDQASGALWFDPDGAGGRDQILFATFEQGACLGAEDILVF